MRSAGPRSARPPDRSHDLERGRATRRDRTEGDRGCPAPRSPRTNARHSVRGTLRVVRCPQAGELIPTASRPRSISSSSRASLPRRAWRPTAFFSPRRRGRSRACSACSSSRGKCSRSGATTLHRRPFPVVSQAFQGPHAVGRLLKRRAGDVTRGEQLHHRLRHRRQETHERGVEQGHGRGDSMRVELCCPT